MGGEGISEMRRQQGNLSRGDPGQGPGRARAELRGPPEKMKNVNCGQGQHILQGTAGPPGVALAPRTMILVFPTQE